MRRMAAASILLVLVAACGGESSESDDEASSPSAVATSDGAEADEVAESDDQDAVTTTTATTTTSPPLGTPFEAGEVLAVDGISEIVGDGTITFEVAPQPGEIHIEVDGTAPVVEGVTCEFCMRDMELGPAAAAATVLFEEHDAQGTSVTMDVALQGPMLPDDGPLFIVAGDAGASLEKVGAGYRLSDGEAWLVTDRSLLDASPDTTP